MSLIVLMSYEYLLFSETSLFRHIELTDTKKKYIQKKLLQESEFQRRNKSS